MAITPLSHSYSFYQQVRLLLRRLRPRSLRDLEPTLGKHFSFTSPVTLDAPESEVGKVEAINDSLWEIETLTHGMTGVHGALPTAYTEWIIHRYYRYGDQSARAFLDIFNNRMQSLRYRAWLKYHYYALAEVSEELPLSKALYALAGVSDSSDTFQDTSSLAIFAHPVRTMMRLEIWLKWLFNAEIRIIPFVQCWQPVPIEQQCRLGSLSLCLGQAPVIGHVYRDIQSRFRIIIGPLSAGDAARFLPDGPDYLRLWRRIYDYVGSSLEFDGELQISHSKETIKPVGRGILGLNLCLGIPPPDSIQHVRLSFKREE